MRTGIQYTQGAATTSSKIMANTDEHKMLISLAVSDEENKKWVSATII
jgi:hypothetical protein